MTTVGGDTERLGASTDAGASFSPAGDELAYSGPHACCPGHSAVRIQSGPTVSGTCAIAGSPGDDTIYGTGAGGDVVLAGAGNDGIHVRNGLRDTVACGPGRDTVWADRGDLLRGCEIVHRP